ncbi:hypothetical protein ACEQ8H_007825 [Pleosporales sp. CAS-2024a]
MSAQGAAGAGTPSGPVSKSQKKKQKQKKNAASKAQETDRPDGSHAASQPDEHDDEADADADADADDVDDTDEGGGDGEKAMHAGPPLPNGTPHHSISSAVALGLARSRSQQGMSPSPPPPAHASARFDAVARERDVLRQEVTELRKSLESMQNNHGSRAPEHPSSEQDAEMQSLRDELEEANEAKEHFETQYKNLLGRVSSIKTSLADRMKADAARIEEFQGHISELEEQVRELQDINTTLKDELAKLRKENEAQAVQVAELRNRSTLSQSNWIKERDELISREAYAREEFENAKQAMQDWEVLAMNERSLRENLAEKESELREQLETLKEEYEKAARDRDTNGQSVEGLQKALQEVQMRKLRRQELKTSVETYESQLNALRKQVQAAEDAFKAAKATLESTQKELERAQPFEKEVKEKNLLIGKLRHEAVTLNEHLTKALRILKKGRPEDNVDKQIITNYFLHFLELDRSDPKKFEALQLISALLGWTDEQREQAGLARPGAASTSGLRIPALPFRRTPSTPSLTSLSDPMLMASSSSNKESLAELWQDFLEREAAEGKDGSRRGSASATSPPPKSDRGPSGLGSSDG